MLVRRASLVSTLALALALACGNNNAPGSSDGGADSGTDAGSDAGPGNDAGTDAGTDAGPPAGSPGAPTLTASSSPAPGAVALTWTPADSLATNFQILRSTNSGGFAQLAQVAASSTTYSDTQLSPGNSYGYEITASDSAGTGAASNEVDVLQAPTDAAAGGSDTRVIVTWGAIENADSYDVYRAPDAGSLQLLGNTTASNFLDDGGVQPIAANGSYSYRVVAKSSAGFVSSIGSNLATATASGIDVTANEIFISDTAEESDSLANFLVLQARNIDGGPLVDSSGEPITYGSISGSGAIVVPGVPQGTYAITVEGYSDYAVTSARAVDFSQAVAGRSTSVAADTGTTISYDLTGLSPWAGSLDAGSGLVDALEELSLGAGNFSANLAYDIATPPDAGATVFAGNESLGNDTDSNLVEADAGDVLYLFQLHQQQSSNGVAYLAPTNLYSSSAFTTDNGGASNIDGALAASTPIAIADFDFPRSAYLDPTHATQNPAATNPAQRVYLELEKGFAAHGWYSNDSLADGLIIDIPQDGGTTETDGGVDLDVGAVSWANPVSPSWDSFALVQSTYDVPFTFSFSDTSQTPPVTASASKTFTSYSSATVPLAAFTFANSALLPSLSAPRSPQLNGTSAFTAQTNVSPTSRLSWSAPALGTPGYYLAVIYALVPEQNDDGTFVTDSNGAYLVDADEAASFTTHETSISLAADLVPSGYTYFATIDAVSNASASAAIDGTIAPYTLGERYISSETVTATFTVAASSSRAHAKGKLNDHSFRAAGLKKIAKGPAPQRLSGRMR